MPFAFAFHQKGYPERAALFMHDNFSTIAEFGPDALQNIIRHILQDDYDLEDFEFFELGKHMPITFERQVSWTLNQQ